MAPLAIGCIYQTIGGGGQGIPLFYLYPESSVQVLDEYGFIRWLRPHWLLVGPGRLCQP
jgi:hypothetical protein